MANSIKSGEIEKVIKEVISDKLNLPIKKVKIDSLLVEELGMDSFGAVELAFELKDKFGITISQEDFGEIKKVKDIVKHILNHLPKE